MCNKSEYEVLGKYIQKFINFVNKRGVYVKSGDHLKKIKLIDLEHDDLMER